jgi:hypothetical protein
MTLRDPFHAILLKVVTLFSSSAPAVSSRLQDPFRLRGTMRAIADGENYRMPATIDDPAILGEIAKSLRRVGYGK